MKILMERRMLGSAIEDKNQLTLRLDVDRIYYLALEIL